MGALFVCSSSSTSFRDGLRAAWLLFALAAMCLCVPASGQPPAQAAPQTPAPLITQAIDESQLTVLTGNTHPLARPQFDLGTAPATLPMERMLLVLKRSDAQEAALRKLLDDQQDRTSPNYHQWMTPEQFGAQFGPTDADMQTITSWLQSHGFQVAALGRGRTVIEFSGSASQVQEAFHTTIHRYIVNGEQHWANDRDPSIPTALTPAIAGILALHNFPAEAYHHDLGVFTRSKATGEVKPLKPLFTFPSAGNGCGVQGSPCYAVGPYDFAVIYDVLPLWTATTTVIDGTGQTIAIVAETDINTQDVTDFRSFFGLPAPNLQVIHNGPPPGIVSDETESDLDVQWSGAVAKGATIDFVVSASTDTTFGVALSAQYIVDTNLAPVMSMSYGLCELGTGTAGNLFFSQLWQQASAQGITAIVSSGDSGSAGCDPHGATPPAPANFGLAVTGWGDTPYNVSVGGTDFFDLTDQSTYWSATNTATTQASALKYIPEATWNNTCTNSVFGDLLGFSSNAETNCNNPQLVDFVSTDGGSGGLSNCTINNGQTVSSCSGGYPKPSWQTANPNTQRGIPDVSLFAAAGSPSGSFYIICESDLVTTGGTSCNPSDPNTNFFGVGGTSASAPAFAGIMALVNQQMMLLGQSGRQGNANYVFYRMATQQPTAFHDVAQGTIRMPCLTGSTSDCDTATFGDEYGVLAGYDAAAGYDLATGLGSVDANVLVGKWNSVVGSFRATTTTLALSSNSITHGTADTVNITVTPSSGTGTPTGLVSLIANVGLPPTNQTGVQQFSLDNTGKVSLPTSLLPGGGPYAVFARYVGDGTFAASDSTPFTVTVSPESSTTVLTAETFSLNGNTVSLVPLGGGTAYGNLIYLRADVSGASKNGFPTGNVGFNDASGDPTIPGNPYSLNGGTNLNPGVSSAVTAQGLFTLPVGQYSVIANYTSDHSFNASASAPTAFTITQAATTTAPVAASANTIGVGSSITLNANISTGTATLPSFGAAPTGTVSFYSNGTLVGSPQPVVGMAGTGTFTGVSSGLGIKPSSAAASLTTTSLPAGSDTITAVYNGDANYAASPASAGVVVTVLPPDFSISAPAVTVKQGQSQTIVITVTAQSGFNGMVGNFTCTAGLPAGTNCSAANPPMITGSGTTTLTITTTPLGQRQMMRHAANEDRKNGWIAMAMLWLVGLCLIGAPVRRSRKVSLVAIVVLVLVLLPSCGGGSSQPPNPVPSISSLSPTQQAAGSQSQTVTINGSGFISGSTVTYNGTPHAATYNGSQLLLNLSSSDMATTGTFPVVVTNPAPGGGSSSPADFNVVTGTPTGTFNVTVSATGPSTTHTATFALTVQ
jgi:hypothetical protein